MAHVISRQSCVNLRSCFAKGNKAKFDFSSIRLTHNSLAKRGERENLGGDIIRKTEAVHVAAQLGDALIQIPFYLGKTRGFTVRVARPRRSRTHRLARYLALLPEAE